jgi:hypothetical protein
MALIQKAFSDIITFSRSSNATRVGPTGLVEYAPHNLILRSQELGNASWSSFQAAVTSNTVAAPDGTVTADTIAATASPYGVQFQSVSATVGIVHTFSIYAKAGTVSSVIIGITDSGTDYAVVANLSNGTINTPVAGSSATISSVGNGWYRVTLTRTGNIGSSINGFTGPYASSGSAHFWGAQLSVGPYALDYTPTTSAAVYGPRFDYDPVTLAARGLLIEEQRTNQALYSAQFDNATWSKSGISVTANSVVSPDGTVTASTITATTANGDIYLATGGTAGTYTASVYVRRKTGTGQLQWVTLDGGRTNVTQTISSTSWTRINYPSTGTLTNNYFGLRIVVSGDEFYVWGAQLEAGSFATSYIPTVASSVTRSADVASVNTLSPWYNATTGTLYTEFDSIGFRSNNNEIARFNNGTVSNQMGIAATGTPAPTFEVTSGGVDQAAITGSAISANTTYKAAASFAANSFAFSFGGSLVGTDTSGTVPTVSALTLMNRSDNARAMNGHLRRLAFYPRSLTTAEMNALTA